MKIDQEYIKNLLEAFESSDQPTTDIEELAEKGLDYQEKTFIFHLKLLADKGLIDGAFGAGLGYSQSADGIDNWSVVPLRLTALGYEFLEAIRNSEVWGTIKKEFKEASVGTLVSVSKQLLEGYAKKKVTSLLGGEG